MKIFTKNIAKYMNKYIKQTYNSNTNKCKKLLSYS